METKEITEEQFYVSIANEKYDINVYSVDHNEDMHDKIRNTIYEALEQKKPLEMLLFDLDVIIIPYKILKTSDIRVIWKETI